MKPEIFIAKKIRSGGVSGKKLAGPVLKVATAGIILGMVVMIISIAVGSGFKREIRDKIIGFGSHIQVVNYDFNLSYESNPIRRDSLLVNSIKSVKGVKSIQPFATKPGLIKANADMQGVVLKGIDEDYDDTFFSNILVDGALINLKTENASNDILISTLLAQMLHLSVGDDVFVYFFQEQIRVRKLSVVGIFDSNMPDLDKTFVIADIRQIQRLNNWDSDQVAGYEIIINEFDEVDNIGFDIYDITASYISPEGSLLRTQTIRQSQPQIFGWLDLLDMNIAVIIVLIILVAGFNMISGILILILERTNMIGILKALGMANWPLRKLFLYLASQIAIKGLFWGNVIGIGLCLIQLHYGVVKLDPENYFLEQVPVYLNPMHLLLLNAGALVTVFLMMLGPSYIAAKISPVKAILFD